MSRHLCISMLLLSLTACAGQPTDTGAGSGGATDSGAGSEDEGGGGEEGGDESGDDTGDAFCAEQPVVTYANFGRSFMTENCQGCHASTAAERYDAPESVVFDTVADCWSLRDRILARSAGDDPSMPPSGGVFEDDRTLLEIWLRCAEEGT